ncbi:MAG: hypothetical protein JOZ98_17630 [Solirubrobacterales bacterium]|nr:hypothetical protein [Solirubrobacterales bacterium]
MPAASDTVPSGWYGFDVVFSHEVLYLLDDLAAHAQAIFAALRPAACTTGSWVSTPGAR